MAFIAGLLPFHACHLGCVQQQVIAMTNHLPAAWKRGFAALACLYCPLYNRLLIGRALTAGIYVSRHLHLSLLCFTALLGTRQLAC
jgi:hypothetical protein